MCLCVFEREREGGRTSEREKHFSIAPTGLIFTKLSLDVIPILMESIPFCRDINIGVYFYSKTNQMHNMSNLFYFATTLYMFRTVFPQAATEPVWHVPDAVCTVLGSWWWTKRPSETCRMLFQNKINLRYCASGWFCYRNILRCTVLQTSKLRYTLQ